MSAKPNRRQELYDRIRNSSKDEVILEEMIRLGFWPRAGEIPADPGDEIRRRGELQRQLDELRRKASRLYNEASLIREARKQRLADARRKKQETRERFEGVTEEPAALSRWWTVAEMRGEPLDPRVAVARRLDVDARAVRDIVRRLVPAADVRLRAPQEVPA